MKITPQITQIRQQQNNNHNNNQNFTGFFESGSTLLRFLDTNQAWGANGVDLCSMVIPRTAIDFINRGPEAGAETGRREATGTTNHSLVGVYGTAAGLALAASLNKRFGIKAHKIFSDNEAFEAVVKSFDANKGNNNYTKHLQNILGKLETSVDGKWVKIPTEDINKVAAEINKEIVSAKSKDLIQKDLLNYSKAMITRATGSEKDYRFKGKTNTFTLENGLRSIYDITKAAIKKEAKGISSEEFLSAMKSLNIKRSIAGLGIATAIGMSTQPINMYLTKKKTGSDGFVGVPGREKDKSTQFKLLKAGAATLFAAGALATITTKPKHFLSKIQFQGMFPTISQLKLVYGLTIASRFLSARDKDELRESTVKDTLGFLNLLVLGALVTKGVARACDKSLINAGKDASKNFFKWLSNSSLKSRDEILHTALKKQGVEIVKNGKVLPFKELIKLADPATRKKLGALNIAQVAGYVYSGLVLGVGVPKLNIYMTNKSEAKRKARLASEPVSNKFDNIAKADSSKFLK